MPRVWEPIFPSYQNPSWFSDNFESMSWHFQRPYSDLCQLVLLFWCMTMIMVLMVMVKTDLDKYVQRSVFRIPGVLHLSLPDNSGNEMIRMMMLMMMMMKSNAKYASPVNSGHVQQHLQSSWHLHLEDNIQNQIQTFEYTQQHIHTTSIRFNLFLQSIWHHI